jgi:hypothetical protein
MKSHLSPCLAALALASVPADAQTLTIDHRPVGCAVAEKFLRLDARFAPGESVAVARVLFRSEKSDQWWAVSMKAEGASYFGVLPKPTKSLKSFEYYIEVTDKALGTTRTAEYAASVVSASGECRGKLLATSLGSGAVLLQGPAGAGALPAGFASTGVVAGSSSATGAAGATAGAAGGVSTGLLIAGVAGGLGVAGVVVAQGSEDKPVDSVAAVTMAGHWVGEIMLSGSTCFTSLTYDLTQTGSTFSGTGSTHRPAGPGCTALSGSIEAVTGTLTGSTFTFTDRFVVGSQFCNESGSGSITGNRATGSTTGTGVGTGLCATTGAFTITR